MLLNGLGRLSVDGGLDGVDLVAVAADEDQGLKRGGGRFLGWSDIDCLLAENILVRCCGPCFVT